MFIEQVPMQVALVLQTKKEAFYYYEDCDICAETDKCDLKTAAVTRVMAAHSADCSDLAKPAPACYRVGEHVRIPGECCSGNAVPAYGGDMECVEAARVNSPFAR